MSAEVVGYVVLTKRIGVAEQWLCDHSGEPWSRDEALDEAVSWVTDNPDYEYALGRVVVGGDE